MNFDDLDLDDEGMIGVFHPLFTAIKQDVQVNEDCNHRGKIFQTQVNCKGQICSLVINTGSFTNAISEEAVKKLGLKFESHLDPYHVAWITNTK